MMPESEKITMEDIYWMLNHSRWETFVEKYPNLARNILIETGKNMKEKTGYLYDTPENVADMILDGRLSGFGYGSSRSWSERWEVGWVVIDELKRMENERNSSFDWNSPLIDIARLKAKKPDVVKQIEKNAYDRLISNPKVLEVGSVQLVRFKNWAKDNPVTKHEYEEAFKEIMTAIIEAQVG